MRDRRDLPVCERRGVAKILKPGPLISMPCCCSLIVGENQKGGSYNVVEIILKSFSTFPSHESAAAVR